MQHLKDKQPQMHFTDLIQITRFTAVPKRNSHKISFNSALCTEKKGGGDAVFITQQGLTSVVQMVKKHAQEHCMSITKKKRRGGGEVKESIQQEKNDLTLNCKFPVLKIRYIKIKVHQVQLTKVNSAPREIKLLNEAVRGKQKTLYKYKYHFSK